MKYAFTVVLLVTFALATSIAASAFESKGYEPFVRVQAGQNVKQSKFIAEEGATWQWGPFNPVIGTAYAFGSILNPAEAIAKTRSTIHFHDPYEGNALSIGADVTTWKTIQIVSDDLPIGTVLPLELAVNFSGVLTVKEQTEAAFSSANVNAWFSLYDNDGAKLGTRGGVLEALSFLTSGQMVSSITCMGDWAVSCTETGVYNAAIQQTIPFNATVGQIIWLYMDIATSANSGAVTPDATPGWTNRITLADADFSQSFQYQLNGPEGISFIILPEPASFTVLLAGLTGALAICRKRNN